MKTIAFIFFVMIVSPSCAQAPFFQHYFLLKKNEPVEVNALFQSKNGIIWLGTNKGLFEFDGLQYKRFTTAENLPDIHVTAIAEDSAGRLWTGHKNGSVAFVEKGKVFKFNPPEGPPTGEISDILFDKKGILWLSTLNDGLYYFMNERLYRLDEDEGMPDLFVYSLAEDEQGNVWAGTDGGAVMCTRIQNEIKIKVFNNASGLPDNIVKKIKVGNNGDIWMATEDAGIFLFDPSTANFRPLAKEQWKYGTVNDFIPGENKVWIASHQTGMVMYDRTLDYCKVYNNSSYRVSFTSLIKLLKDVEGNIWAGSKMGVLRTHGDEVEFIDNLNPALDANIVALATDKQGQLWFATREGLFVYKQGAMGVRAEKQLINTPFQRKTIISMYVDSEGYVWAGLYGEGVLRINPANGKVRLISSELKNGNVLHVAGKGNVVWLATLGGGTEIKFKGEELQIKNYGSEDGLISDYIYQVFIDRKNRVWFATDGKGVDMLDEQGFHHFEKELASKVIYGFAEDGKGQIWANVQGSGLYRFDGSNFTSFPAGVPLRDYNINGFSTDKWGNLVAMHELGIDVFNPEENRIRYLGDETGIHDRKPNLNAVAIDNTGRIYFGTESGIVSYSTSHENAFASPKPYLRELKIFDKTVALAPNLKFGYDENNLTLSYQGLWYQNPQNVNYRFRLENYDVDWINSRNNSVTYSRLPPGEYTFRLQVSDVDNFNNAEETTFHFLVHPPFWRTTVFYGLTTVGVIALGYAFLFFRERKLRKDKLILEAKVEHRTQQLKKKNAEIQAQNDEIQAQNEEIHAQAEEIKGINDNLEQLVMERTEELEKKNKALEEYAFINAHKLRAPVASVLGLINLLNKTELNNEAKAIQEHLKRSADELDAIVYSITKAIEKGNR